MSIKNLTVYIFHKFYEKEAGARLAKRLVEVLVRFGLNPIVISDYPSLETNQDILLLDASFETDSFGQVDLSFPILKIFKSCPNFTEIDFHDFIIYPFTDEELISRILNLYNIYKNIVYFQQVNNRFKSYLLNLSHDVYSPVKLVKSQIDYLRLNSIYNQNEYHNSIFESTLSQLDSIVNILLSVPYQSLASDKIAIGDDIQSIDFAYLLKNTAKQLELYASNQGVDITVSIHNTAMQASVESNYNYLWRMVYNLLLNSIKYCVGGGTVKTSLSVFNNNLRWETWDTGIGMSFEQLDNIQHYFDSKSDDDLTETDGGFGRGLVVIKLVTVSLDAIVKVESELGVGTTFTIDIPFTI